MSIENPRATIGDNQPDYALEEVSRLQGDYIGATNLAAELLEEARALPEEIDDDATKGKYTSLIKRIRDHTKLLDAYHGAEKQPHLRRGQGVDQFFFGVWDKLARRDRKAKPGALDILSARLTDYDTRKLREEQERRRKIAEEEARVAAEKAAEERRLAAEAEAARLAAERARKPENVAARATLADQREAEASAARVEAEVAAGTAEAAHIETLAKPADIMRMRGEDGTLSTMGTEPYAEVEDREQLDKAKLWPFLADDAIEKALRAWAKTTGHKVQMPGAKIGRKPKSVVR